MNQRVVVAVDVGGTGIKATVLDRNGRSHGDKELATPTSDGPDAVVEAVRETVRTLVAAHDDVVGVGVVVPGDVDAADGVARYSANLGWRNVPLRGLVNADVGVPTVLEHDVRAAGLAERTVGTAGEVADSVVAVLGTGIAAVINAGGRHVCGAIGIAGEFGHAPVWPDGELCACGQRGCLERYASAAAIARRYGQRTGITLGAAEVIARVDDDAAAAEVWQEAVTALGIALASCTMLLDPALIVLGGGLSRAGRTLRDPVRDALAQRVTWRKPPDVELSALGARAGLVGAGILAWQAVGLADFARWEQP
jgi:glucokinase